MSPKQWKHKNTKTLKTNYKLQEAQLSQRDRAAGWISYGQK